MAHMDSAATHIHDLPDDVLVRIFWPPEQTTSYKSESDDLWNFVFPRPKYFYGNATPEELYYGRRDSPMPSPPASAEAGYTLLLASICQRWRRITQRHVSSLLVKEDRVVSHQDVLSAVACLPHLTHLHLSDSSVEILNNAFLADLSAACPRLRALYVGKLMLTADDEGRKKHSLITKPGLDNLFRRCPDLEQLSLYCLWRNVNPPASFFQLRNMRILVLSNSFFLKTPEFNSLASLTALSLETTNLHYRQLSNILYLTNLTWLSLPTLITPPSFSLAQLPSLNSLKVGLSDSQFSDLFPLRFPYRFLKRLQLRNCNEQESLPDSFGEVMPCLQDLSICYCRCFSDLTDRFTSLSCLEKLTLSSCNIFSLPANFGNLPALETLVLDALPLRYLPSSFTKLSSLETFLLLGCEDIVDLPEGFGCLTALQTLSLALPPALDLPELGLPYLDQSDLNFLDLTLPDDIGGLTNLHTIRLNKNCEELYIQDCSEFKKLPESVTALVGLRVLRIESCPSLFLLPRRLDSLTRLKQLEISGCDQLDEAPQCLPLSLQSLFYKNDQMVPLPDMSKLSGLRDLRLGVVHAVALLTICASLSGLEHLELTLGEDTEEFPSALTSLSRLHTLAVKGAHSMKSLLQSDGSLDGPPFQALRQLSINTSDKFTELPAAITILQHLTSLQIHAPNLSSLPDEIGAVSRLRRLNFSNCSSLTHLPASLADLSCLTDLKLSNTSVCLLPPQLTELRRLKNFDVSNCKQLEALPHGLQDLKMLDLLYTRGCDKLQQ